jgi:hypothetical protein
MLVLTVHSTKQQKKEAALQKACRRCPAFFSPKTCTSAKPQIKIFFFGWVLLKSCKMAHQRRVEFDVL